MVKRRLAQQHVIAAMYVSLLKYFNANVLEFKVRHKILHVYALPCIP